MLPNLALQCRITALNEMDAMDDWKTIYITKLKSVAPLLALPSQPENDLCSMGLFLGGLDKI